MTYDELIRVASAAYPENLIQRYQAGEEDAGDTLAEFIGLELEGTFDEEASSEVQLAEAIRVLEVASRDLRKVIGALEGFVAALQIDGAIADLVLRKPKRNRK